MYALVVVARPAMEVSTFCIRIDAMLSIEMMCVGSICQDHEHGCAARVQRRHMRYVSLTLRTNIYACASSHT